MILICHADSPPIVPNVRRSPIAHDTPRIPVSAVDNPLDYTVPAVEISGPTGPSPVAQLRASVPQSNGRAAQWTFHETARLIHVVSDPSVGAALARYATGMNRSELDARLPAPFSNGFYLLFNDESFRPQHPNPLNIVLRDIKPNRSTSRDGSILKTKFADIRKDFTMI